MQIIRVNNQNHGKTQFLKSFISLALLSFTSPLDFIKTRLQTATQLATVGKISQKYKGAFDCIDKVKQKEGLRAFWKGYSISVMKFFPNENVCYYSRKFVQKYFPNQFGFNVFAAIIGGWTATSLLYPFDSMRLKMNNSVGKKHSAYETVRYVMKKNGLRHFYQGFSNSLLGVAIFRGLFHGIYDTIKKKSNNKIDRFGFAYLSAFSASLAVYPLDSIRKRQIALRANKNAFDFIKIILKNEGIRGLFRGSYMILLQSCAGALFLTSFDNQVSSN